MENALFVNDTPSNETSLSFEDKSSPDNPDGVLKRHPDTPALQAITFDGKPSQAIPRTPTQVVPPCSCFDVGVLTIDKIMVFDNFLEKDELQTAIHKMKTVRWTFGHKSNSITQAGTPFWSSSINNDTYFTDYLLDIIQKTVHKNLKLDRVYANGQTFGQDGTYHTDSVEENTYTFVLYLHEIDISDVELAGGHLYFKFPDLKYNICYEPILNRGIFFPSNYFHKACSFSRYIMELRKSVAWKLTEIK